MSFVLFSGVDANGNVGLWRTDGTLAGTVDLTPNITLSGPSDFVLYEDYEILFDDGNNLWVTDGTTLNHAGLLPNTSGGPVSASGPVTVVNGKGLFASGSDLWVTDGNTAQRLSPIDGASTNGLNPKYLVAFNGLGLFEGSIDPPPGTSGGTNTLWVTDGTAAGTQELTGINGAPVLSPGLCP